MAPPQRPSSRTPAVLPRPYAEFQLGFLVGQAPEGTAGQRLDGLERALTALSRRWRAGGAVSAARDVRLASSTLDDLTRWVELGGALEPAVLARLGVYHSGAVADATVPPGWVRLYLEAGQHDPRHRHAQG